MAKRKLEVEIIGDSASLVKALGKAGTAGDKYAKQTQGVNARVGGSFAGMAKRAVGMAAAVGGAYASIAGAKNAISTTEDLAKTTLTLHKNLGLSVHAASQWAAVAKSRDIDSKALNTSFGTLAKNAYAARGAYIKQSAGLSALGNSQADTAKKAILLSKSLGPQSEAFKKLGVSQSTILSSAKTGNFDQLIHQVADGFGRLHAGTEKTALGMKLFGKGWQTVLPLLRGGSKAMDEQLKLADKYGVTFKGKTVKSVQDLIAAQRESKFATMGLQVAFATQLAPAITKGINAVSGFVAGIRNGTGAGGKFGQVLGSIASVVRVVFGAIKSAVSTAIPALVGGFNTAKNAVTGWVQSNSASIRQVLSAFRNAGIGIVAVLSVAFRTVKAVVSAVMPGITQVVRGSLKIISGVVKVFSGLLTGDFGGAWRGLKKIVSGALNVLIGIVRTIGAQVVLAVKGVAKLMVAALRWGVGQFFSIGTQMLNGLIHGIASMAKSVFNAAKSVVKGAVDGVKGFLGINSPSRVFHDIGDGIAKGLANGIFQGAGKVRAALGSGVLFPVQEAIAKLQAERDKFQASMDAWDQKRARQSLVHDLNAARHAGTTSGGGGVKITARAGGLDSEQRKVLAAIVSGGSKKHATAKEMLAAVETGLVEQNLHNGAYGDGTSVGWRQETQSSYGSVARRMNLTGSVGRFFSEIKGLGSKAKGMTPGQMAQAVQRSAFPARYDGMSAKAKALLGTISTSKSGKSSGGSSGNVKDALKALKDFDREAARTKKLAAIDLKIKGLQQLGAYKDAIAGIKAKLKDLATQAAATWRTAQEKAINATHDATVAGLKDSADAQELARLQKADSDKQDADTTTQLNQDLADAVKSGDVKAQKDAQDAIDAYARQKREAELQANLDAATASADDTRDTALAGMDQQEADYAASLQKQFDALTGNLEARKSTYADWAKSVNGILQTYGLGVDVSSDDEATINAGPHAPTPARHSAATGHSGFHPSIHHRAGGGLVGVGQSYWVGEMGPERFTPTTGGVITSARDSRGGRGGDIHIEHAVIGSTTAAARLAHTWAYRMRYS